MTVKKHGLGFVLAASAILVPLSVGSAHAAIKKPVVPHFSLGASLPQGDAGDFLDDGWALHGGATWFSANRPIGLRLDFGVDWWDVKSSALAQIDTDSSTPNVIEPPDDGDARAWSGTVNFLWEAETKGTVGFYLTGGLGVYYASWNISEDGVGVVCNWWYCYGVSGQYLISSGDSWEWGYNAGFGVTFHLQSGSEVYLEGVYHWVETDQGAEFVPVSVGFRW